MLLVVKNYSNSKKKYIPYGNIFKSYFNKNLNLWKTKIFSSMKALIFLTLLICPYFLVPQDKWDVNGWGVLGMLIAMENIYILGWPKCFWVFSIRWLYWCLVVFNFIRNNFVRLYCDSYHISMHLKKLIKISEICAAILILKMEEDIQHFWCIMLY